MLTINIIGAGNLGKTIGYLLANSDKVKIGYICNKSKESSTNAIKFIGSGNLCEKISELPHADITLIATPDDSIEMVCKELSKNNNLLAGDLIFHCSGSLTSDALISSKEKGCITASIHPMRSFAVPELSIEQYKGTYCALEGDNKAIETLQLIFEAIGSTTYLIDKNKKTLYHASGVFASNYLVTLSQLALNCLQEAGVENDIAMQVITNIMKGTVSNLEKTLSPKKSLTGPLQRGDIKTVKKHIEELPSQEKDLYQRLALSTLALTSHDGSKLDFIRNSILQEK